MIKENFYEEVKRNNLYELLSIPFYLVHIKKLFDEKTTLPNSKTELFEGIIELKINEDIKHYKTTKELTKKKNAIHDLLTKIAITMELLGRNYILDEELKQVISEHSQDLLNYTGLFEYDKHKNYWKFQHNNFQEFLAAKKLSKRNVNIIKQFLAFPPNYDHVIPSWTNTLAFLAMMYGKSDLLKWLLEIEPNLLLKFEKERVPKELRLQIVKDIFNYYKARRIWIDKDKYDMNDLGTFSSDDETIELLLKEMTSNEYYTTIGNAIELLGFVKYNYKWLEKISAALIKFVTLSDNEVLITRAINALIHQRIFSKEIINIILEKVDFSNSAHIRSCLYHLINESDYQNEYVKFYLDGIKYIRFEYNNSPGRVTLVDEGYFLSKGIEKIKDELALVEVVDYFINNPKDLHEVTFRQGTLDELINNFVANLRGSNSKLFPYIYQLFLALGNNYLEEENRLLVNCFNKSNTIEEVLN